MTMGGGEEESLAVALPFDRAVEQAIVSIKKGAYLLKCGRRGKPKLCPFRLSPDERNLIWCSGQQEKHLRLSGVTKIIQGQGNIRSRKQNETEKECHSFSLIYANGERTLDLQLNMGRRRKLITVWDSRVQSNKVRNNQVQSNESSNAETS